MLQITNARDVAATTFHLDGRALHFSLTGFGNPQLAALMLFPLSYRGQNPQRLRTLATFRLSGALARGCLGANSLLPESLLPLAACMRMVCPDCSSFSSPPLADYKRSNQRSAAIMIGSMDASIW